MGQGRPLWYNQGMSVQEIEEAITKLPSGDLAELAEWFQQYQNDAWDEQIARDARAGRFDALIRRAQEQFAAGQCKPTLPAVQAQGGTGAAPRRGLLCVRGRHKVE